VINESINKILKLSLKKEDDRINLQISGLQQQISVTHIHFGLDLEYIPCALVQSHPDASDSKYVSGRMSQLVPPHIYMGGKITMVIPTIKTFFST
jgi:hypothetical protein